jgi:hypothetical protein
MTPVTASSGCQRISPSASPQTSPTGRPRRSSPRAALFRKQARRRYYGADRISENGLTLYNPAKMTVERYRYRGAQIGTPFNIDVVDPAGARFRHTSHDDMAFVGQVSEQLT